MTSQQKRTLRFYKGRRWPLASVMMGLAAFLLTPATQAQSFYHVSLNTAPLVGQAAGPFSLDFQLTDGSGLDPADGNNKASLNNFLFGDGGTILDMPVLTGGAQGDLSGQVLLQDTGFLNDFQQTFVPGDVLSFDLALTGNVDTAIGAVPDQFSFAILDSSGTELPTQGLYAVGSDVLLSVDITGPSPVVQTFGSDSSRPPQAGGSPLSLDAPQVQDQAPAPVPEASTAVSLGVGLLALGLFTLLGKRIHWQRILFRRASSC